VGRALELIRGVKGEGRNPGLSADAFPFPPFSKDTGGRDYDYLHVTNDIRVYELTFVFSL
jgi:hypothetical protein